MINAHGGTLKISENISSAPSGAKRIEVDSWTANDAVMICEGAFSPLDSFMSEDELKGVHMKSCLPDGTVWTIPVVFRSELKLNIGEDVILSHKGQDFAVFHVKTGFLINDAHTICRNIFGTDSMNHPGVKLFLDKPEQAYSGKVTKIAEFDRDGVDKKFIVTPTETRKAFKEKKWDKIVGFQTRNPIHRGHEFLHKMSLSFADAVFIHPLIGDTKSDDVPYDVRFRCYEVLTSKYYNPDSYFLSALVAHMNYAGPKEAIHHAIIRQNFGCSHMIIGRDHAGVGSFYTPYEAQEYYETLADRLDIKMVKFSEVFYCEICKSHSSEKMCGHTDKFLISGTTIRNALVKGEYPDERLLRKEVADVLINYYKKA